MTIKIAEVTIIKNFDEENIFSLISRYLGLYYTLVNDNDTIILEFDDGTLCDTRDEYKDLQFKFAQLGHNHGFPIYFEIQPDNKDTLFFRNPNVNKKGELDLKFNKKLNKYKSYKEDISQFNLIYEDINKKDIFSILKIQSIEEKPRFIIAYDDSVLDRSSIVYLSNCMFKLKFT